MYIEKESYMKYSHLPWYKHKDPVMRKRKSSTQDFISG